LQPPLPPDAVPWPSYGRRHVRGCWYSGRSRYVRAQWVAADRCPDKPAVSYLSLNSSRRHSATFPPTWTFHRPYLVQIGPHRRFAAGFLSRRYIHTVPADLTCIGSRMCSSVLPGGPGPRAGRRRSTDLFQIGSGCSVSMDERRNGDTVPQPRAFAAPDSGAPTWSILCSRSHVVLSKPACSGVTALSSSNRRGLLLTCQLRCLRPHCPAGKVAACNALQLQQL
jgi:hypothetical protein